ncbi:hypothetical protein D3C72_1483080 [compost metagenome]
MPAAEQVDHEAIGDLRQVLARFVASGRAAPREDAQIRVVRQVGRIEGVAQLAAQPALQPAVVVAVEHFDLPMQFQFGA